MRYTKNVTLRSFNSSVLSARRDYIGQGLGFIPACIAGRIYESNFVNCRLNMLQSCMFAERAMSRISVIRIHTRVIIHCRGWICPDYVHDLKASTTQLNSPVFMHRTTHSPRRQTAWPAQRSLPCTIAGRILFRSMSHLVQCIHHRPEDTSSS